MADNPQEQSIYSENDTLDINELATLNEDISLEFIEKLQTQVAQDATAFNNHQGNEELFEEIEPEETDDTNNDTTEQMADTSEDDFTNKYNAKKNNNYGEVQPNKADITEEENTIEDKPTEVEESNTTETKAEEPQTTENSEQQAEIENVSGGNIIERPLSKKQEEYIQEPRKQDYA